MKKIDIYLYSLAAGRFVYECSTRKYKTCKEAKKAYLSHYLTRGLHESQVKTCFAKE